MNASVSQQRFIRSQTVKYQPLESRRSNPYQPQVQRIIDQHTELDRVLYNAAKLEYEKVRQRNDTGARSANAVLQEAKKDHLFAEVGAKFRTIVLSYHFF